MDLPLNLVSCPSPCSVSISASLSLISGVLRHCLCTTSLHFTGPNSCSFQLSLIWMVAALYSYLCKNLRLSHLCSGVWGGISFLHYLKGYWGRICYLSWSLYDILLRVCALIGIRVSVSMTVQLRCVPAGPEQAAVSAHLPSCLTCRAHPRFSKPNLLPASGMPWTKVTFRNTPILGLPKLRLDQSFKAKTSNKKCIS